MIERVTKVTILKDADKRVFDDVISVDVNEFNAQMTIRYFSDILSPMKKETINIMDYIVIIEKACESEYKWNPVDDCSPSDDRDVLLQVFIPHLYNYCMFVGYYNEDEEVYVDCNGDEIDNVLFWGELPEPRSYKPPYKFKTGDIIREKVCRNVLIEFDEQMPERVQERYELVCKKEDRKDLEDEHTE